ncbi:MAG: His/Gly/Thr/Pro-type tRNA ligase C-terminal domain-containing protein [Candidatus Vogelbacteria bacterium]|nr:His/Gly/Thr/Pro-type tRNA ligase C-terminal domain-containing protein [Candidatus Vogelbacteria bacterium]
MLRSQLFTKTRREDPKDEVAKNAKLLIRAGFIHKELAGVYSYLPLGLRVIEKIKNIIREEMNALGGEETQMTVLQNPVLYEQTNRWSDEVVDNWFKTELKSGGKLGLGLTHEEEFVEMLLGHISSYKDLPLYVYQIQKKFRNEARAKSGIMRGREFMMKDMYSFHANDEDFKDFYDKVKGAYERIFERVGLGDKTYITFASGGIFSKYSHEYQTLSEVGEDTIYVSEAKKIAINQEVMDEETLAMLGLKREELVEKRAIETGNIFELGTKYSDALSLEFADESGQKRSPIMGCYGMGVDRLMGAITEVFADDNGLVWPREVSPFKLSLICLAKAGTEASKQAEEVYQKLTDLGVEVLFDERDISAGEKMAEADLFGFPYRAVISEKTVGLNQIELKERQSAEITMLSLADFYERMKN